MSNSIQHFRQDFGSKAGAGFVVHPGEVRLPLAPGVMALPFADL